MRPLAPTAAALLAVLVATAFPLRQQAGPGLPAESAAGTTGTSEGPKNPVLVELFTSEGCSSCPPADALLVRLSATQGIPGAEVIALEEHVDYWNHLGWADPFSSPQFSRRQEAYAEMSGEGSVYTPQMVVDGRRRFVGSEEREAHRAIAESARDRKTSIRLVLQSSGNGKRLAVSVPRPESSTPGDAAEVYLAMTEDGLQSAVFRGENAGHNLSHAAVVRSLEKIGVVSASTQPAFDGGFELKSEPGWNVARMHAVVFVQELRSRRVLGAAAISLQ